MQFVCFDTNIEYQEFSGIMKNYLSKKKLRREEEEVIVMKASKDRFRYVSRHITSSGDFKFVFNRGRNPDIGVIGSLRIIQVGGYKPLQVERELHQGGNLLAVMIFVNKEQTDVSVFREIKCHQYLNIYEAYFESCAYSYILEYFVETLEAEKLLSEIKSQPLNSEAGIYSECLVMTV